MNYNDLLSKIDIVDVISHYSKIAKAGNDYKIVCPFHDDKDPSLNISAKKQIFKCFVCNVGGNAINFIEKYLKISYSNAANLIAKNFDIKWEHADDKNFNTHKLTEQQLNIVAANQEALKLFKYNISDSNNKKLQTYLNQRQLSNDIINYFQLGYAIGQDLIDFFNNNNLFSQILLSQIGLLSNNLQTSFFNDRIIFPIFNQYKELVGFSGRIIEKNDQLPKYINSPESKVFFKQKILFNLNNAWDLIKEKKEIIICEGFMDVIALHRINVNNVVALMGTALSDEHLKIFKLGNLKINITLFLDPDNAGINAMMKSIYKLISNNFQTFIIKNSSKLDPDEIFVQRGPETLKKLLLQKENAIHFYYEKKILKIDQESINNFDFFKKTILHFAILLNKCEKDIQNIYIIKLSYFFKQEKEIVEEIIKSTILQQNNVQKTILNLDQYKNDPSKKINETIEIRYLTSIYYIIKLYLENKNEEKVVTINFDFNIYNIILDKIYNNFRNYYKNIRLNNDEEIKDFDQYIIDSFDDNLECIEIFKNIQKKYLIEKNKKISTYIAKTSSDFEELELKIKEFHKNLNEDNWINNIQNQKNKDIKEKSSESFLKYHKFKK